MSKKDSYWFRHDSNAGRDLKMLQLKHIYDFWGIGLYWTVIELLREQPNYKFKSDESSLQLASNLVMCSDTSRFFSFIKDCVRLELLKNEYGFIFSESLIRRMNEWEIKKTNGSKGGRPKKTEIITEPITETKTEVVTKSKPKGNHKRREDNIIEEKKIEYSPSVFLTLKEFEKLGTDFGVGLRDKALEFFSNYAKEKPHKFKEYKDHNLTIRRWVIDAVTEKNVTVPSKTTTYTTPPPFVIK